MFITRENMILGGVLLIFIIVVFLIQFRKISESFEELEKPFVIIKNEVTKNYTIKLPEMRGKRELALIDYMFFLNDYKAFDCKKINEIFLDPPYPNPEELWNSPKKDILYKIENNMDSMDWILFKSIIAKLCVNGQMTYSLWTESKPYIENGLQKQKMIFSEQMKRQPLFGKQWRDDKFSPLYDERDVQFVNVYSQDLSATNESLLKVDFNNPNFYDEKTVVKTYNDNEVKPDIWLNEKDINIESGENRSFDEFDAQRINLDFNCERKWFRCYENNFRNY